MSSPTIDLHDAKFISLRSFKKNGEPVDTPVWFAHVGQRLVVFTNGTSYKVKRIRRNPSVQVAACDVRGKLLGPWLPGACRPVEHEPRTIAQAYAALNAKYGLLMRIGTVFATLSGRAKLRLILEIDVSPQTAQGAHG